jgi:6-phosphogluconolactonase (cycloisomerase 2 family)
MRRICTGVTALALTGGATAQSIERAAFVAHDYNLEGSVASFVFDENDHPVLVQRLPTPSTTAAAIDISPSGRFLAMPHASAAVDEDISIIEVDGDANLRLLDAFTVLESSTALDIAWFTDELLAVPRASSSGQTNELRMYRFDPTAPSLTLIETLTGNPPFGFLIGIERHPTLPVLYVADSPLSGAVTIRAVRVDETTGAMTEFDFEICIGYAVGMAVSKDGSRLYSAGGIGGSGDLIEGWNIEQDGSLTPNGRGPWSSPDDSPKGLVFGHDGRTLFAAHGGDGRALSFTVEPSSGALAFAQLVYDSQIGFALGDVATLDDILLVTDESTIFDNQRGLLAYRYDETGAVTPLGGIVDTGTSGAADIAVWSPETACYADCTGDETLDVFDFLCFQDAFVAGCP